MAASPVRRLGARLRVGRHGLASDSQAGKQGSRAKAGETLKMAADLAATAACASASFAAAALAASARRFSSCQSQSHQQRHSASCLLIRNTATLLAFRDGRDTSARARAARSAAALSSWLVSDTDDEAAAEPFRGLLLRGLLRSSCLSCSIRW